CGRHVVDSFPTRRSSDLIELQQVGAADERLEPADQTAAGRHATVRQPGPRTRVSVEIEPGIGDRGAARDEDIPGATQLHQPVAGDRKSTRLNSSHVKISY